MTAEGFKRRLSAILSADVKEYSRLMRDDEDATIRTLTAYRSAIAKLVQQYRGRVVDSPGDNVLAEFGSVVDAVNCAVEIQRELAERNAELPYERQMQFRIGINSGDVVQEGERIYGDGVNIAARVEGLAEGGGICISGNVHDGIEGKLGLEFEYLGEHEVKNIDKPIRVYRILSFPGAAAHRVVKAKTATERKWRNVALAIVALVVLGGGALAIWNLFLRPAPPSVEPASVEKMAFPLPDEPSIAVLPFANISGDPKEDYLSDGITEQIITGLSKTPKLFVIARNSTFAFKGKAVKVQQVAEELGVRYVLEGSVQKSGEKVRMTAQLIDAITGHHLWAERYDRALLDIFALQDEITMNVITALQVKLTEGEAARIYGKGTDNLDAYIACMQGHEYVRRMNIESNELARKMFEKAIALDPTYARAYRNLGLTYYYEVFLDLSKSPKESVTKAMELAQKAIALDESLAEARSMLGFIYAMKRQPEKGLAEAERGFQLNPNSEITITYLGVCLMASGRAEEAIPLLKKVLRLDPFPNAWYFRNLALAYYFAGRPKEAVPLLEKALKLQPDSVISHRILAACYSALGREEEARGEGVEVLRLDPNFTLESFRKIIPYRTYVDRFVADLSNAGLK